MFTRRKGDIMKKIKSKTLVLSLIVVMTFALASCGNKTASDPKEDALSKLNAVMEKGSQNTYADIDVDGIIEGSAFQGVSVKYKMNIKSKAPAPGKFDIKKHQVAINMEMIAKAQSIKGKVYMKDGYTYTDMLGKKFKVKIDKSMGSFMHPTNMSNLSQLSKLDKEYVKEASADGDKISVSLDYGKFFSSYFGDMLKGKDEKNIKEALKGVKTFKMVFTVKDDEVKAVNMTMKMSIDGEDMKMNMDFKYNKLAKDGKVSFPSDLSSYPAMAAPAGSSPLGM